MGMKYYNNKSLEYWQQSREYFGYYLDKYLDNHNLNLLYMAHNAYTSNVNVMTHYYNNLHADTGSGIPESVFKQKVNKDSSNVDYDLIIIEFHHGEDEQIIEYESNILKSFASSIAKSKHKRVSIGFFSYSTPNTYIFYSTLPDGDFMEEQGDMLDAPIRPSGYIGKMLFIHNKYTDLDKNQKKKILFNNN